MATKIVDGTTSISTTLSDSIWKCFSMVEASLVLVSVDWLLPGTWISRALEDTFWFAAGIVGVSQEAGHSASYAVGYMLLVCLLIRYAYVRRTSRTLPIAAARFADAMALVSALFLLDFFLSLTSRFCYEERAWSLWASASFFVMILYLTPSQIMRLLRVIALTLGMRGLVTVYVVITEQKHSLLTPVGLPNAPCALYLLGAPLCAALCVSAHKPWMRWLFAAACAANMLALGYTYTGIGWVGLAVGAMCVTTSRPRKLVLAKRRKTGILITACALIVAGLLLAGRVYWQESVGNDRAWAATRRIVQTHPWLGNGFATYDTALRERVAQATGSFAQSHFGNSPLYLRIWAEFGLLGLGLMLLAGCRYAHCYRRIDAEVPGFDERIAVIMGITAGVIALVVAGIADSPVLCFVRTPDTFALVLLLGAACGIAGPILPAVPAPAPRMTIRFRRSCWVGASMLAAAMIWIGISALWLILRADPIMDHYVDKLTLPLATTTLRPAPDTITDALIAAEDRNFYSHHGVDWDALHRALRKDIRGQGQSQGGSTITMQAVRYMMLPYDKTPARKIAQIVLAEQLETRLPKSKILRLYFDSVSFGLHTAGLQRAAKTFFGKRPERLTLAESAFLVGTISHPPYSTLDVTPEFVQNRMTPVLDHMEFWFGSKYGLEAFERARRENLQFTWEKNVGGVGKAASKW